MPIAVPKLLEQKKIADCLSSIDDLISAEEKKLSLLNDYKKGWMQKLFPAEGKTFPEWKFPEFGDNDGWMEKKLGEIGEPLMCKRVFKEQTSKDSKNGVPFYKIGTFENEADSFIPIEIYEEYKNKYSFPKSGDILISASGTIGRSVVYNGSPAYFQDTNIVWIDNNERQIINQFLYYCYSNLKWQTSDGGTVRRLYNSNLKNMVISYPKNIKEQKKNSKFFIWNK
ncbi:restriction endonuclease subunit S [Fusobacterium vincentii]